jgi:hypothetical protein
VCGEVEVLLDAKQRASFGPFCSHKELSVRGDVRSRAAKADKVAL